MRVIFIHHSEVIEYVLLFLIHAAHTILNNHRQLISKSWIIGHTIRNGRRHQMAMAILMLQTFAIQCGAPGRAPQQKAASALVARRPHQIADTLKAKHGIVDIERHHRDTMVGVGRGCGNPR